MRFRSVLLTFLVGSLAFSLTESRAQGREQLDELPAEIAANLRSVPGTQLLVSIAPPDRGTSEPPPDVVPLEKECQSSQEFFSYVLFPVTICTPNSGFGDVLAAYQSATAPTTAPPGGGEVQSYRLSSFAGQSVRQFCFQTSGPFGVTIVKTVDCNSVRSCQMALPCPGCGVETWYGDSCESQGRPPELHFFGELTARPITFTACAGSLSQCGDGQGDPPPFP
jgi:hypothetical protein